MMIIIQCLYDKNIQKLVMILFKFDINIPPVSEVPEKHIQSNRTSHLTALPYLAEIQTDVMTSVCHNITTPSLIESMKSWSSPERASLLAKRTRTEIRNV